MAIDKVFASTAQHDLPCYRDLAILFKSNWRLLLVTVVEDDGYTGFGYTGLAAFIDQVLDSNKVLASR